MKEKVKKGIVYLRKYGWIAFFHKVLISIRNSNRYLYLSCRVRTKFRMMLKRAGLLKRAQADAHLPEIIISLTSFPPRIGTVYQTIESLLVQTYQADRLILWLAEDEFPHKEVDLPPRLRKLCAMGLEIRWCENMRSYKKLIPTLECFPDAIIITFDDDILAHTQMVERLVKGYQSKPNCIHSHRVTTIDYQGIDNIRTIPDCGLVYPEPTYLHKLTGCSGCLYPPCCFYQDITNVDLVMKLAPTNDDIWFWLMGALNGYKVNVVEHNIAKLIYIPKTQEFALSKINDCGEKLFFVQLRNILRYYPVLDELLKSEQKRMEEMGYK